MRLVVLQPFYLPYAGVFELVRLADTFVLYDDVQFSHQHWDHRNRIKTAQGTTWLTVPVHAEAGTPITDVRIADDGRWSKKHWTTLRQAYARAPHRDGVLDALRQVYDHAWEHLVDLNLATFRILCELIGVDSSFLRSSDQPLPGASTQRLVNYCRELGATAYLSGPAAKDYLDEGAFQDAGIALEYFEFDQPEYPQLHGDFVPYLSVVDLLANCGADSGAVLEGCGRAVATTGAAR